MAVLALRAAAMLTSVSLLVSCNADVPQQDDAKGGLATVAVGTQPWIGYGPWYIAKEKGFDTRRGVSLDLVAFNTDADLSSAFEAGQLQAGNAATNTVAQFLAAGQKRTIVLFEDVSTTADAIIADSSLRDVADLKGTRVAYEEGTTSDTLLRYALSTVGLTIKDIVVVPTPASSAGAALLSGDVDVAVTYEPYISSLLAKNKQLKRLYAAGERPGLISDTLTLNSEWASANPKVVRSLLLAWDDAVAEYRRDPAAGQAIIAKAIDSKPAELASSFDGVEFYTLKESNAYLKNEFPKLAKTIEGVLAQTGSLKTPVDINAAVDTTYGEAAVQGQ